MEVITRALKDGSAQVWFSGSDTFANKDRIKTLGYKFGEMNFDCIMTVVVERVWHKVIPAVKQQKMAPLVEEYEAIKSEFGDLKLSFIGHDMTLSVAIAGLKKSNNLK